jgi:hypothetical protein
VQYALTADHFQTESLSFRPRHALFVFAHVLLGYLMNVSPMFSSLHAWVTAGIGIIIALNAKRIEPIIYVVSYIVGCEVLWRMTEARVFWETGKYLTFLLFGIGLLRFRSMKSSMHPLIYFIVLVPAIFITIAKLPPAQAKDAISFNLSGPLTFTVFALFFSRFWLRDQDLQKIFLIFLGPVLATVSITLYSTLTATQLVFGSHSMFLTSGGFGPNQVSAIVGLGGLFCFLLFLTNQSATTPTKAVLLGGWALFTLESALTYSRGGIYMEFGAIAAASFYSFREQSVRFRLLFFVLLLAVLASIGIIPYLDSITSGTFSDRYSSVDSTGRDSLIKDDLKCFYENPFFGVGIGMSTYSRTVMINVVSHTEYTRALAEHGMLGAFAVLFFFFMLYRRWIETKVSKPLIVALIVWGLLFLSVYATRLVSPLFLLALPFVTMIANEKSVSVVDSSTSVALSRPLKQVNAVGVASARTGDF